VANAIQLDPAVFAPEAISPQTALFNEQLEALFQTTPSIIDLGPQAVRDARASGNSVFGAPYVSPMATTRTVPSPSGDVPIRVFLPDEVRGVYLYIHGGGWTLGRAEDQDARNEAMARNLKVAVVSVEYRLAPEHPYPAGPDDCEAVGVWLAERARAEFGTDRLMIGGESAGAHLSVVTLLRLRDRHGFGGFAGANLIYGCYDLSFTPSVRNWGARNLVLSTPICEWFANQFVSTDLRHNPDVSPLYADLRGLPPALFSVGTLDPLVDDTLFMLGRWLAAGNAAELAIYPGGIHGFNLMPLALAEQANGRIDEFIGKVVS
jgi:acetyl esterase/lipase